ncbi:MAG: hypothetical protein QGH62_01495 [Nitrospinaceae bacterium]|nr:hypothetical protein [Nitrospinaceae bacterium]
MSTDLSKIVKQHTCLYASFDQGIDADFSRGDGTATYEASIVQRDASAGRYGGALIFSASEYNSSVIYFDKKVPFT